MLKYKRFKTKGAKKEMAMRERTKRRYKRYWKIFKDVKLYILVRYISILVLGAVCSVVPVLLSSYTATISTRSDFLFAMSMACICFLFVDVILMRKDYYRISHRRKYKMVNCISQGMYLVTNLVSAKLFGGTYIYTCIFGVTNVLNYTHHNIDAVISALVFNAVVFGLMQLAPIGLHWVQLEHG